MCKRITSFFCWWEVEERVKRDELKYRLDFLIKGLIGSSSYGSPHGIGGYFAWDLNPISTDTHTLKTRVHHTR